MVKQLVCPGDRSDNNVKKESRESVFIKSKYKPRMLKAPVNYLGSKYREFPEFCQILDTIDFAEYHEPFGGSAANMVNVWVDGRVSSSSMRYNDIDPHVVNVMRQLQAGNASMLGQYLEANPIATRENFAAHIAKLNDPDTLENDPFLAACCFLFVSKHAVFHNMDFKGGKCKANLKIDNPSGTKELTTRLLLNNYHGCFKDAIITNDDYKTSALLNDRPGVLQFWDQPYVGTAQPYNTKEKHFDQYEAADVFIHQLQHATRMMIVEDDAGGLMRNLYGRFIVHQYMLPRGRFRKKVKTHLVVLIRGSL